MGTINKVILIGYLGADPEIFTTDSGKNVSTINIATQEKYGDTEYPPDWHRVVLWEQKADYINEYAAKGALIYVEGRLTIREWENDEGETKYTTEIIAYSVQIMRLPQKKQATPPPETPPKKKKTPPKKKTTKKPTYETPPDEFLEDDIPF
ncbi:MAG: single-stranded DNA-binding protein [Candidatus Brocadiales bacterium]|nr:single-stranded DNA-binding protein [Candidatus Brocadiales bacterium]